MAVLLQNLSEPEMRDCILLGKVLISHQQPLVMVVHRRSTWHMDGGQQSGKFRLLLQVFTLYIGMEYALSHRPWSNSHWQTHFVKQPRANNPNQLAGLGWLLGWLVDWLTGWLAAGCTGLVHGGMRVGMGIQ